MKYYVATLVGGNQYILNEFDSLTQAYKFYLEDASKRIVLREARPEVIENVRS